MPHPSPRTRHRFVDASVLAAAALACAAAPRHAPAGTIPVGASYSTYDAALLPGVVGDTVGRITYGASGSGSGVYLGDGWVLTAAHVADDANQFVFTLGGNTYNSAAVILHPDWDFADQGDGFDLALIRLTQPVPSLAGPVLYTGRTNTLVGKTATIAGYGTTGDGAAGEAGPLGTLHAGTNRIDRLGGQTPFGTYDAGYVFTDFDDPAGNDDGHSWSPNAALTYEYMISRGDSGGGLFIDEGSGLRLAGLTSVLLADDGVSDASYNDIGGFFTLPPALLWIAETTGNSVLLPGDADQSGLVEQGDLDAVLANWGRTNKSWRDGDFDASGRVEQGDLDIVLSHWGLSTAPDFGGFDLAAGNSTGGGFTGGVVPEPAAALALLVPVCFARRKR